MSDSLVDQLCAASARGDADKVLALLENEEAIVNDVSQDGSTALIAAAAHDRAQVVEILLAHHADVNQQRVTDESTALHAAAAASAVHSAQLLLGAQADANILDEKGDAPLAVAARLGCTELVQLLLEVGAIVDAVNQDGATALCGAASSGSCEVVNLLIDSGANINAKKLTGWSPLSIASFYGYTEVVTTLLDRGADVNIVDVTGATPLFVATYQGLAAVVRILLDRDADTDIQTQDGLTPMYLAVSTPSLSIMELLLEAGVSVDIASSRLWTPLHAASFAGHADAVKLVLDNDANIDHVDADGDTALAKACSRGHAEVVRLLLESGAATDRVNSTGRSALFTAAENSYVEIVEALLDAGGEGDLADDLGITPLHVASASGSAAIVTALIDRGASVNAVDITGKTALMAAASRGRTDVVVALLERGASSEIESNDGESAISIASHDGHLDAVLALLESVAPNASRVALFAAAQEGHFQVVEALIQRDVATEIPNESGDTALAVAARHGHADVVVLLLDAGVSFETANAAGRTPLHQAAAYGSADVTQALLERGATPDTPDAIGDTPLHLAARHGHSTIVVQLLASSTDPAVKSTRGESSLLAACWKCHVHVVALLLGEGEGAGVDEPDADANTPLVAACSTGCMEIVKMLTDRGASLELSNAKEQTPLLAAASHGHFELVRVLLKAGASANVQTANGDTLLMSAGRWGRIDIAGLLFETGWDPFPATDDGGPTLLTATLDRVLQLGPETQEFEGLWMSVAHRFVDILGYLAQEQTGGRESVTTVRRFVRILMRFIGLRAVFEGVNVFARLVGSRRVVSSIQDVHTEIDHFTRQFDWNWSDPIHSEWFDRVRSEQIAIVQAFARIVHDEEAFLVDLEDESRQLEALYLLEYEKKEHSDVYTEDQLDLLELYLTKTVQVIGDAEPVPEWFIPSHEVEIGRLASVYEDARIHRGEWLRSSVLIRECDLEPDAFVDACNTWFPLTHPNVINVFGASHLRSPKLIVFENASSTNLMDYLADDEHQQRLWRTMFEVALGLGFLHERQIVLGELRCDDIWVGKDGLAMVPACVLSDNGARSTSSADGELDWRAPELMRGEAPTFATDVYAFGICIVEAVAGKTPWADWSEYTIYSEASTGYLPARPDAMDRHHWSLVQSMCRFEPSERVLMTNVMEHLKIFAATETLGEKPVASGSTSSSLRDYIVPELSTTIDVALSNLLARCAFVADASDVARHVHDRLTNIYEVLQDMRKVPRDVEVRRFCDALVLFYTFMRAAISATSMAERAKSRRVSLRANVLHREIDVVLDLLQLSSIDSVHEWVDPSRRRSSAVELPENDAPEPEREAEGDDVPSAVRLVRFDSSPLNARFDAMDRSDVSSDENQRPPWLIPIQELRYKREDAVGAGAFGAVYRGAWLDTPVVVKFMGYEDDADMGNLALFFHELRVWYPLHHPHVVRLFGACHIGKRYFVCEYAGNGTLLEFLQRAQNHARTWKKLYELALGLQHVHKKNIVHNDLKCDNFLVGSDGKAKIADFGLSCIPNVAEVTIDPKQQGATQWRSPEYLRGERLTLASDIYSLGMCILEAVTRSSPWGRTFDVYVRMKVKKGCLPPRPPTLTAEQWGLVEMMCAREPSHRLQIASVVERLRESWTERQRQFPIVASRRPPIDG